MQIQALRSKTILATLLTGLLVSTGCGGYSGANSITGNGNTGSGGTGNGNAPSLNTYAYVGQQVGSAFLVSQFLVGSDGSFTALNPASVPIDAYDNSLTVDPSGNYLYLFTDGSQNELIPGTILQFVVGSDGTLAPNSVATVATGGGPGALVFTPNGSFAIESNGDNTISSYSLSSTGSLTLMNTVLAAANPGSVAIDSSGKFVYVLGAFSISEYTISSAGELNLVVTYPFEIIEPNGQPNPIALTISPKGFLYVTAYMSAYSGAGPGDIVEFSINEQNGGLSVIKSYSTTDSDPGPILFDPTGAYAYVSNGESPTISQFTVDAVTGVLKQNGPDVAGGFGTGAGAVDPSGKFLFTVQGQTSSSSPQVSLFTINADGTLTPSGAAGALGANSSPISIAIVQR
jgi:DNA-binding beta-propeller fold protein YncE